MCSTAKTYVAHLLIVRDCRIEDAVDVFLRHSDVGMCLEVFYMLQFTCTDRYSIRKGSKNQHEDSSNAFNQPRPYKYSSACRYAVLD